MKKEALYFQNFAECATMACDMSRALSDFLENFNPEKLDEGMTLIHNMENQADGKKHELYTALLKAFVTPIDRDEIINISQSIDDVMDAMDEIMIEMNITQVKTIQDSCLDFAKLINRCCIAMADLMEEFKNFKKSKKINDLIIEINHLEEEGDRLYISAMKKLHATSTDPLEVIAWREIYAAFELVCDKCEDVADIVEGIFIENM